MSNISSLLHLGKGALSSHQQRLGTIQNNIANASTPGYTRQRVDMVTLGGQLAEPSLMGVATSGPNSVRTPFLNRQLPMQQASYGYSSTRAQIEGAVEATIFPSEGPSLGTSFDDFFSAARELSANPSGDVERRSFVQEATSLANRFKGDRATLVAERESVRGAAFNAVDELNGKLGEIAELNKAVEIASKSGHSTGDMVDRRNGLISEVAEQVEIRIIPGDDETVQVATLGGRALVEDGRARTVELRDSGGALELTVDGPGGSSALREPRGSIGGMLDSYNDGLGEKIADLDTIAEAFASRANAVHSSGFDANGNPGQQLFDFVPGSAAATVSVSAAVVADPSRVAAAATAANAPGGNGAIDQLVGIADEAIVSGASVGDAVSQMRESLGRSVRSASNDAEASSVAIAQLQNLEASVSGVSLEEEMIALTEAQRAYEAAVKVIQTTDEMMETVLSLKR